MSSSLSYYIFNQILVFLLILRPLNVYTQNTNNEQSILLQLKQFWSDPPPLSHWTPSSSHCTWPEVTCTNGSVTELKLINLNISGSIPSSLCDLRNLTYVDFQFNYFGGPFPTAFYGCSNLQYLDLSQNVFTGALPGDIDRLSPQISFLSLEANNFSNDIPATMGNLTNLVTLRLTANLFNGSFPEEIGNLLDLEELVLSENGFSPQSIPDSFTKLKKLKNLWMTQTNLIGQIPENIGNMSALEFLDLSVNSLSGNIPDGLFLLQNLTHLFLFKNRLSGSLPQTVKALNLQVLDLSNNTLSGPIPDDFGNLTSLTGLALFFNQLSGEVPVSIGRLPGLVDVGLFSNNLSGVLPPDFGRYSMLVRFQVSSNQFIGQLPPYLCHNKVLIGVIAFENHLTGELPDTLNNCDSLEIVRVHDNQLSGKIPDGLWTSKNLSSLMISNNAFAGQIPDKMGPVMSTLELMNNQFSGPIPSGVSSWEKLTVFTASNNMLSGSIPQELTALSRVETLSLDGNRFSGQLPSDIISWNALTTLNLNNNQLSGEIPSSFGLLPRLLYLDLSNNELSGQIPLQINQRRLNSLNLSDNQLSGRIPSEYDNTAFDRSFLNNPSLCSGNALSGIRSCSIETQKSSKHSAVLAIVSSIAAVGFVVALLYTLYIWRNYRKQKHSTDTNWKLTSFQRLNFTEAEILSSLNEENMIGSGGSGQVYRVQLSSSGKSVAVKKIWNIVKLDQRLEKEFLAEVKILGSVRHSNIVKLLCCMSSERSKLLVYEYMENQSLDRWIHRRKKPSDFIQGSVHQMVLGWPKRLQIAIGAAKGLCYLHHHCSPPIIHRDLKSSNILLDSEFNAKIADFGLARMLIRQGEPNTMSVVAGSFGYMAPEYAQTRLVNEKIDVYSFGVILLELITGREAHLGDERSSLSEWAWRHVREGNPIIDAMDEDVRDLYYTDDISTVFKLGLICTSTYPSSRPEIKDVLQILLRCGQNLPDDEKKRSHIEYDAAPLLEDSKRQHKAMGCDDSVFDSVV